LRGGPGGHEDARIEFAGGTDGALAWGKLRMYRCPRNRVARAVAERVITRRLVRRLMIEYEYISGLANRPRCWLLGHEGRVRRGYLLCEHCGQKVRAAKS
jgi:hypothetical protein